MELVRQDIDEIEVYRPTKPVFRRSYFYKSFIDGLYNGCLEGLGADLIRCQKREVEIILIHTHGSQSTLMAPQVLLPHSWMNFSIEKTPVRSSTLLPHSLWRPLLLTAGSLEIHPMCATPITLEFRFASRTPVQQFVGSKI